jgi:hypothetical protein
MTLPCQAPAPEPWFGSDSDGLDGRPTFLSNYVSGFDVAGGA